MSKVAIVMVGLPGSGKSTRSRAIIDAIKAENLTTSYHSTDDFMLINGKYEWRPSKLSEFHSKNLNNFALACAAGINVVICDNTNLPASSREPYLKLAKAMGYRTEIHVVGKFDDEFKILCSERNTHGVNLDAIDRMADRYQPPKSSEADVIVGVWSTT